MAYTYKPAPFMWMEGLCFVCGDVIDHTRFIALGSMDYCSRRCVEVDMRADRYGTGSRSYSGINHADAEDRQKIAFHAKKWKDRIKGFHKEWGIYKSNGGYHHDGYLDGEDYGTLSFVNNKLFIAIGRDYEDYMAGRKDTLYIDAQGNGHLVSYNDALRLKKEDLMRISESTTPPSETTPVQQVKKGNLINEDSVPADVILEYKDVPLEERMASFVTIMDEIFYLQGQRKEIQKALNTIKEPEVIENVALWRRDRDEAQALKESTQEILDANLKQMEDLVVRGRYLKTLLHGSDLPKEKWIKVDHRGLILKNSGDAEMLEWEKVISRKTTHELAFPSIFPSGIIATAVTLLAMGVISGSLLIGMGFVFAATFFCSYLIHMAIIAGEDTKRQMEKIHKMNQELGKIENTLQYWIDVKNNSRFLD
jgi:hypothetical protein